VLLVDRDGPGRDLAVTFLARAGYRVTTANDGSTAWSEIRRAPPDAVVSEILLPGVDGLALCRQIRAEAAVRDVRVLILSMLSAHVRAVESGADAFLHKPITEQTLVAAVRGLIDLPLRAASGRGASHGTPVPH